MKTIIHCLLASILIWTYSSSFALPIKDNTITENQTICAGDTPAKIDGKKPKDGDGPGTYIFLWQNSTNSLVWDTASGTYDSRDYTPPALFDTTYYRRIVFSGAYIDTSNMVVITVNPLPSISFSGDINICIGESSTITASGGVSYLWSTTETTPPITVTPTADSTYYITVTNANSCVNNDSVTVIVNPLPTITITGDDTICVGESTTLTASGGVSYLWSTTETTAAISVSPVANTTYYVTVTNGNDCVDDDSIKVIVNTLPTTGLTGSDTICEGSSTTLTASGGVTYLWSTTETTAAITVSPVITTIYTVTATDGNGCTDTEDTTVVVKLKPTASISGDDTLCLGETSTLTATGGGTYLWSTTETTAAINVSPVTTITYYVTVTAANGCTDVDSVLVVVHPLPTAILSGNDTICFGQSTTLTASGGVSYLWSNTETTAAINVSPTVNTAYIVTVTDINGCTDTDDTIVVVNLLPTAIITGDDSICYGESTTLTASGGVSYFWSTTEITPAINVSPTVTTGFSVVVTDANGCSDAEAITVTVHPLPTIIIAGDTNICIGESTTLTASGGTSYLWSTAETSPAINVSPLINTGYSVSVTDIYGCTDTKSTTVVVNLLPVPDITGVDTICFGEPTTLTATAGVSFIWSTGSTANPIIVSPTNDSTFYVTVTDINSCSEDTSILITVHPLPIPEITGIDTICLLDSTTLTASGGVSYLWSTSETTNSIKISPPACTTYSVTVTDANTCSDNTSRYVHVYPLPTPVISGIDTICLKDSTMLTASGGACYLWSTTETTASIKVSPDVSTTYSVTVTDVNTCSDDTTQFVKVRPLPIPIITGIDTICLLDSTTLTVSGGTDYLWNTTATTDFIKVSPSISTTYFVTVTDSNSCVEDISQYILVHPLPVPIISGIDTVCFSDSTTLTATGGVAYLWSTAETTDIIDISPPSCTTYIVTVTDANTCSKDTSRYVHVYPLPIPNIAGTDTICLLDSTTLTATGGVDYLWNTSDITDDIKISPPSSTTYTVTVTDANTCSKDTFRYVHVHPLPIPIISGIDTICFLDSTILTATGGVSYLWNTLETTDLITVSPDTGTTYSVIVTDSNTCHKDTLLFVKVHPLPIPLITGDDTICVGDATTLTASGGISYLWDNAEITDAITVSPTNSITYIVTVTDINSCSKDTLQFIKVHPLPIPEISGIDTICFNDSITLTATGGVEYLWNTLDINDNIKISPPACTTYSVTVTDINSCFKDTSRYVHVNPLPIPKISGIDTVCFKDTTILTASGGASYLWNNASIDDAITISPDNSTTYTVTATDINSCSDNISRLVTVHPLPIPKISGTFTVCEGSPSTLTASGGIEYLWSTGFTSNVMTIFPSVNTTLFVTVTDENGCFDSDDILISINSLPSASISGTDSICNGESTDNINCLITGNAPWSITYSNGDSTQTIENIATSPQSLTVNPSQTSTYTLTSVTDKNGCLAEDITGEATITVFEIPVATVNDNFEVCGTYTELTATPSVGIGRWTSLSDVTFNTDSLSPNANIDVPDFGSYTFIWTELNTICSDSDSAIVTFYEQPPVTDAGENQELFFEFQTELSATFDNIGTGVWTFIEGDGDFANPNSAITSVSDLKIGENILRWTISNGVCTPVFDDVAIIIIDLIIPTGFSPNGDNINDFFEIIGIINATPNEVVIYNRWGAKIFEANDYKNEWNGKNLSGQDLPEDTYFYAITVRGDISYNGYVVIKR